MPVLCMPLLGSQQLAFPDPGSGFPEDSLRHPFAPTWLDDIEGNTATDIDPVSPASTINLAPSLDGTDGEEILAPRLLDDRPVVNATPKAPLLRQHHHPPHLQLCQPPVHRLHLPSRRRVRLQPLCDSRRSCTQMRPLLSILRTFHPVEFSYTPEAPVHPSLIHGFLFGFPYSQEIPSIKILIHNITKCTFTPFIQPKHSGIFQMRPEDST